MRYYEELKQNLQTIYDALIDEESKDWFDARVEYMINRNLDDFFTYSVFPISQISEKMASYRYGKVCKG